VGKIYGKDIIVLFANPSGGCPSKRVSQREETYAFAYSRLTVEKFSSKRNVLCIAFVNGEDHSRGPLNNFKTC
jgi:hypothetical protein